MSDLLLGSRTPRLSLVPRHVASAGQDAIDLAASAGLLLDPWQQDCLHHGLAEDDRGMWAAFEAAVIVSRQNGKGGIFEARCLAGLFLFDERLILYSAHEFKTAAEMFLRIKGLIDNTDALRRRVRRMRTSHGDEGVELLNGARLRFVARSTGSGRGFSGDLNIWDEAYNLPNAAVDALMPTMSAKRNPQLWYGSSAPDKTLAPCDQLGRVRERALAGIKAKESGEESAESLYYAEWSIDPHTKECARDESGAVTCTDHDDAGADEAIAKANPALGIRISLQHVLRERSSMSAEGFGRERLGVGNWPTSTAAGWKVIGESAWRAVADPDSEALGRVAFAIHVSPDRRWAAIGAVGLRADGLLHAEVIDYRPGTKWVVERARELDKRWDPCALVVDAGGPAGSLIADLEEPLEGQESGLEVLKPTTRDVGHAYGQLVDAVQPETGTPTIRVMPHPALDAAVAGAVTRKLGEAKAWDALATHVDICTLVAVTYAGWGFATRGHIQDAEPVMPFGVYA